MAVIDFAKVMNTQYITDNLADTMIANLEELSKTLKSGDLLDFQNVVLCEAAAKALSAKAYLPAVEHIVNSRDQVFFSAVRTAHAQAVKKMKLMKAIPTIKKAVERKSIEETASAIKNFEDKTISIGLSGADWILDEDNQRTLATALLMRITRKDVEIITFDTWSDSDQLALEQMLGITNLEDLLSYPKKRDKDLRILMEWIVSKFSRFVENNPASILERIYV